MEQRTWLSGVETEAECVLGVSTFETTCICVRFYHRLLLHPNLRSSPCSAQEIRFLDREIILGVMPAATSLFKHLSWRDYSWRVLALMSIHENFDSSDDGVCEPSLTKV